LGKSTADVLLTMPPTPTSAGFLFYRFCRQNREPTSGLEPLTCSLRVRSHTFVGVPHCSKSRLLKPSLPIACFPMFAVVRPGYCHGYCQLGEVSVRELNLRPSEPQSDATDSSPSWCVRSLRLFRRFSMIWRIRFVHCVPVRISPVAVRFAVEHRRRGVADKEAMGRHPCSSWATAGSRTRRGGA
jgi:hypothetical protein